MLWSRWKAFKIIQLVQQIEQSLDFSAFDGESDALSIAPDFESADTRSPATSTNRTLAACSDVVGTFAIEFATAVSEG